MATSFSLNFFLLEDVLKGIHCDVEHSEIPPSPP
jgi:hypothetical protein